MLRSVGTTALFVTHDQAEAMTLADHLVVIRAGRVVSAGDPRQVGREPVDAEPGQFLGEAVVVPGTHVGSGQTVAVDCALGRLPVAAETRADRLPGRSECEVLLRPEQLNVRHLDQPGAVGSTASVVAQSFYGHDALVRVRLDDLTQLAVRVPGSVRFGVGERVRVQVDAPVWTYASSVQSRTDRSDN